MSFRERRRSTPLPVSADPNVDFQSATEAMQRAADAMIAATESFRQQFHQQDINTDAMPMPSSNGSNSSGSNSGGTARPPSQPSSQRTPSRRRPASYQPYRPPSETGLHEPTPVGHVPLTRPGSAAGSMRSLTGGQTGNLSVNGVVPSNGGGSGIGIGNGNGSFSAKANGYPPPVQRKENNKTTSPRNPYSTYRAARAGAEPPAPPVSLHNTSLQSSAPLHSSTHIPMSEFYTVLPDIVPRDDSGIAMAPFLNNPRLQLVKLPGPLAMHPVAIESQLPQPQQQHQPQQPEQQLQQQLQQQLPQQQQSQQLAESDVVGHEFGPSSASQRASHASWSLVPKLPKTPEAAAHSTSRRLTSPALPPISASRSPVSVRRPSMSSYIDLIEAASRLKRTHSYQGGGHAGDLVTRDASFTPVTQGGVTDDGEATAGEAELEPEPIIQIGRYTYVRSEAGDHDYRASLIRDDGSRRYTTMPLSRRGSSLGYRRSSRRSSLKPPKPKSMGPCGFSLMHETLFVLIICLSQVLMLAGIAQALIPARIMGLSFPDTSPGNVAWYTAAYGLTSGTFVLPSGRLGDLFGHRRIFIIGFVWFAAWSLLAGFAPSVQRAGGDASPHSGTIFFIVCRAMQGIGPAMLVPNGQAMLGRAYPPGPRKNMVMSLFGASSPLGFVVGAVMSALFAIYASWPWAFWTLAAVCAALAAVSMLVLPADEVKDVDVDTRLHSSGGYTIDEDDCDDIVVTKKPKKKESLWVRMDGMGIILGVAGLVLVNFAFNQAPIVGWATQYTYLLLILGLFFLAAFIYVEAAQAAYPLVPLAAMRSTTNFVLGCTATGWGCFSVWVYYAVQMLENLRGWSPLMTSAAFAPAPVTGLVASLFTGFLFSRGVKPHWVMLISMFAFFVGSLLFATSSPDQLYWFNPFFSILIMPFGMDMSNPAAIILVSNSVRREHQGIAASLVVTFVNYAISLALGIAGSVEAGVFDPNDLLVGYRAAQYFGLGLGGLGILFGTAFLCQSYLRTPSPPASSEKAAR